ncbi:MAG: ATP-binding cassette domain-containing protein [Methanomassiliicoccales archaeon]|jgi:lipooligosaccharide transport system ATP-binding protein|nr:ATP-binding cassette domain-containing protein [Methanomassiliicoccales archaeon]
MKIVVKAENLTKRYDSFTAVNSINFEIREGECFGFLGPNGAGKTTVMKMIYCASPITSGKLFVLGLDVEKNPREIKGLIGVAPQENNLDPDFTVLKNLTVYARYFGIEKRIAERKAMELLEFMQLKEKADVEIPELSGGMKRRLIIARALINDPKILILDEPTTGLDPQARHLIWDKIRELRKSGVTVIMTTHYMDEAERLCDRLVIMDRGKILVEGNPQELIEQHSGQSVLEIVDPAPEVESYLRVRDLFTEKGSDRIYVYTENPQQLLNEINGRFSLQHAAIRRSTLEDVFLKLTGRGLRD